MLLYRTNQHNIVKRFSSNKKINLKNINEPNSTIKKHRIIGWIIILFLKKDLPYAASKRLDLDLKSQAENEGIEIDSPCECNEKKAGITIPL